SRSGVPANAAKVASKARRFMPGLPRLAEGVRPGSFSLTFVMPDHLFDLLLDRIEVEGSRVLHRRIVHRGRRQLPDELLDHDEAPELAGKELVHVAGGADVE